MQTDLKSRIRQLELGTQHLPEVRRGESISLFLD